MRGGWQLVLVALALAHASSALAEEAQPGIEMKLEERGPCSVIACEPVTPRKRQLIRREIAILERVLRNADMRPKHRELFKLHRLLTELLHAEMIKLSALRAQTAATCASEATAK